MVSLRSRLKPRFRSLRPGWRAIAILVAVIAVILLPIVGYFIASSTASSFPYPGLNIRFAAASFTPTSTGAVSHNTTLSVDYGEWHATQTVTVLKMTVKQTELAQGQTVREATQEKFVDVTDRQEYAQIGTAVVPTHLYTIFWLPEDVVLGQTVGVGAYFGNVSGPTLTDMYGRTLASLSIVVETAEGIYYYSTSRHVLTEYVSTLFFSPVSGVRAPLNSLRLVQYDNLPWKGLVDGGLASLFVVAAAAVVFGLHHSINTRRRKRLEGLRNRIVNLVKVMHDQYTLGAITQEAYGRKIAVAKRALADVHRELGLPPPDEEVLDPRALVV